MNPETAVQLNGADVGSTLQMELECSFSVTGFQPKQLQCLNGTAILIVPNVFHCKIEGFALNYPARGTAERQQQGLKAITGTSNFFNHCNLICRSKSIYAMTGRRKWEETGNKITLLPAQWKECRCVSTGIFETDSNLMGVKISFMRKFTLHGTIEHLP